MSDEDRVELFDAPPVPGIYVTMLDGVVTISNESIDGEHRRLEQIEMPIELARKMARAILAGTK
jgi:hypothetical protein